MIYLCGGFRNNWQKIVIDQLPNGCFFNPRDYKEAKDPRVYTIINRNGLDKCDVVFAYLERDNPSPMNVPLECGYMLGKGGRVILCNEWKQGDVDRPWFKQSFIDMLTLVVTFYTTDFGTAINRLRTWIDEIG